MSAMFDPPSIKMIMHECYWLVSRLKLAWLVHYRRCRFILVSPSCQYGNADVVNQHWKSTREAICRD